MPQKKNTAGSGRKKTGKPKTPAKKSAKPENSFLPQITPLILAAAAVLLAVVGLFVLALALGLVLPLLRVASEI